MLRAYLHGARFDVLTEVTYLWRQNATGTSQQKADLQNLLDRAQAKDDAWRLLTVEGTEPRAQALARKGPGPRPAALPPSRGGCPDEYRDVLRRTVTTYLEPARESGALSTVSTPRTRSPPGSWPTATGRLWAVSSPRAPHPSSRCSTAASRARRPARSRRTHLISPTTCGPCPSRSRDCPHGCCAPGGARTARPTSVRCTGPRRPRAGRRRRVHDRRDRARRPGAPVPCLRGPVGAHGRRPRSPRHDARGARTDRPPRRQHRVRHRRTST